MRNIRTRIYESQRIPCEEEMKWKKWRKKKKRKSVDNFLEQIRRLYKKKSKTWRHSLINEKNIPPRERKTLKFDEEVFYK